MIIKDLATEFRKNFFTLIFVLCSTCGNTFGVVLHFIKETCEHNNNIINHNVLKQKHNIEKKCQLNFYSTSFSTP